MLLIFCPAVTIQNLLLSHQMTRHSMPFLYPSHFRCLFFTNLLRIWTAPAECFFIATFHPTTFIIEKSDQSYQLITLPFYRINIASPKLKKRYLSLIASSYAFNTCSLPANAETSITSVDSGRWKFVIRQSSTLN